MQIDAERLSTLHTSKLEQLKEIASEAKIPRSGSVERLRIRLIQSIIIPEEDLSWEGIQDISNQQLSDLLKIFGIKSSGSQKDKRQRIWLHIYHDPKKLTIDSLTEMNRDDLHELCARLEMPRSGNKTQLVGRVAGVLSNQEGAWGRIKRSVKRGSSSSAPAPRPTAPIPPTSTPISTTPTEEIIQTNMEEVNEPEKEFVEMISDEEEPLDQIMVEETKPLTQTIEVGAEIAFREVENREAELRSLIRDFLIIGEQSPEDIAAFIEDLNPRGFDISHNIVKEFVLNLIQEMAQRKEKEHEAQSLLPGSWRERQAIRRFEEERGELLDSLEDILISSRGDIPSARMAFENFAKDTGLDLELPAISGRVHGLFDLQISLNDMEMDVDPVAARRDRAIRLLLRRVDEIDSVAKSTLERMEQQIEALERIVETVIRRNEGKFTSLEHSLMVRFLERRGWDVNHPEVRPRLIAAAGVLAVEMGYISEAEMPTLPGQIALDPERVSDVVDTLNDVLESFGKKPARTVEELNEIDEEDIDEMESARKTLDSADAILDRLRQLGQEGA
ncbi:MAG: hypothetical protein CMA29_04830 [Euryarchaeota archaeon]|nr:hypothetical protein [Euryarchaeota archaeon]|tara:strand:+ start:752 stop:2431 length:1680 start_codon:yes stop_codon:yes gene_type:complete